MKTGDERELINYYALINLHAKDILLACFFKCVIEGTLFLMILIILIQSHMTCVTAA